MLSFRVTDEQRKEIERRAAEDGFTVSGWIKARTLPQQRNFHATNGGSSVSISAGEFTNRYEYAPTFTGYGWAAFAAARRPPSKPRKRRWWRLDHPTPSGQKGPHNLVPYN